MLGLALYLEVEYASMGFALFFLAEYAKMAVMSALRFERLAGLEILAR
jgi:NADH:ubiquinone oxidoreductase subunit H